MKKPPVVIFTDGFYNLTNQNYIYYGDGMYSLLN